MKHIIATVILASAAVCSSAPATAREATPPKPPRAADTTWVGLYVSSKVLASPNDSLPDTIYQEGQVHGVFIRVPWNNIEPQKGTYVWNLLDNELTRARKNRKQVSIGINTGSYVPSWLYAKGVENATLTVDTRHGCRTITIPMPWDQTYQREYAALMQALASHLNGAVSVVKITPITEWTEETRMPGERGPRPNGRCTTTSNALAIMQAHGYRPSKVVAAWQQAAKAEASAFPKAVMSIATLTSRDFPLIDESGNTIKSRNSPGWVDVKGEIISACIAMFGANCEVQWNALGETESSPVVISAGKSGATVGWQTNEHMHQRAGCDSSPGVDHAPCTVQGYQALLKNGLSLGGRYIEVWPDDALAFPDVIESVQASLKKGARSGDRAANPRL
jgi:hypothetical protein